MGSVDWSQYDDTPAQQAQSTPQAAAPVDWSQYDDAPPAAAPVPTPVATAPAPSGVDWSQYDDKPGGGMAGMQTPASPTITATPYKQTSKNSFELGLDAAGKFVNDLPIVKEVKSNTWNQTLGNLGVGVPYGLAQVGDVGNTLEGWIPRAIEGGVHSLMGANAPQGTPVTDALIGPNNNAMQYRQAVEQMPGYAPATFKAGGMVGQMALPGGLGVEANTLREAALMAGGENAVMGGVSNAGDQLAETGKIDPLQLAGAAGLSGVLGTGAGAAGYGLSGLLSKLKPRVESQAPLPEGMNLDQLFKGPQPEVMAPAPAPDLESLLKGKAPIEGSIEQTVQPNDFASGRPGSEPIDLASLGLKPRQAKTGPAGTPVSAVDNEAVFRHQRTAFGRNKADEGLPVEQFPTNVQKATQAVAEMKAKFDYQTKMLDQYTKQLWAHLEKTGHVGPDDAAFMGPNKAFITKNLEKKLSVHDEADLAKLRETLAGGTTKLTSSQHVQSTLGGAYGGGNKFDMKLPEMKLAPEIEQAFNNLVTMKRTVSATEKAYKAAKEAGKPHFEAAQSDLRQVNPQASFNAKTKVLGPLKDEIDVNVSLDHNPVKMKLDAEAEKVYQAAKDAKFQQLAKDRNYQPKTSFTVNAKNVKRAQKALALAAGAFLLNPGKAKAEDGLDGGTEDGFDWGTSARLAGGLALVALAAPKTFTKLVSEDTKLFGREIGGISLLFNDTVNRIENLDQKLGTKVGADVWQHLGAAHSASFGIKIDADVRQQALDMLRNDDAAGFKGLNLTVEQERALLTYKEIQKELKAIVKDQIDVAETEIERMTQAGEKTLGARIGLDALGEMDKALSGSKKRLAEQWYNAQLRKFMDFHFFYNPAFHLTNLTDQIVSIAPKVGPMNLTKANIAFTKNAKLKKLFENSNLTGGYEADKVTAGAIGKVAPSPKKFGIKLKDFNSDKVNADRAALASMFQYRQLHGIAGSDEEFAEKLLTHQLAPDVAVDAWAHTAEALSRTVGADPLKVNTNVASAAMPIISAFVKQPARLSNLMAHYLANGELKKFYFMLGGMALVGGDAAIPQDAKEIWKRTDPKTCFMASALLSKCEVASYATGKSMSQKTQWAILAPVMMSSDPLRSTAGMSLKSSFDTMQALADGKEPWQKVFAAAGSIASMAAPRWGAGAPAKQIINSIKTGKEAIEDTKHLTYYDKLGQYAQAQDVSIQDDLGISPIKYFADQFLPGEEKAIKDRKLAKEESHYRSKNWINGMFGDQSEGQVFNKESDGYANDPLNMFLRQFAGKKQDEF